MVKIPAEPLPNIMSLDKRLADITPSRKATLNRTTSLILGKEAITPVITGTFCLPTITHTATIAPARILLIIKPVIDRFFLVVEVGTSSTDRKGIDNPIIRVIVSKLQPNTTVLYTSRAMT